MDPNEKLLSLIDTATGIRMDFLFSVPVECCVQLLHDLFQAAVTELVEQSDTEKAFILFLRFVSCTVEELPKHKDFKRLPEEEQHLIDVKTIEAIITANLLKTTLRNQYEKEYHERLKKMALSSEPIELGSGSEDDDVIILDEILNHKKWPISFEQISRYLRCQDCQGSASINNILIPSNISELFRFLQIEDKTEQDQKESKFALIYGTKENDEISASHLQIFKGQNLDAINIPLKLIAKDDKNNEDEKDLVLLGFITNSMACGSLAEKFLAGTELKEIICILCLTSWKENFVLHLLKDAKTEPMKESIDKNDLFTHCPHFSLTECFEAKAV